MESATKAARARSDTWLAVETSTQLGSVAVWKDELVFEYTLRIQGAHSERLLPAIDHALQATATAPEDVSAFVVGSGPGSFTGVRIAASLAKGWAMARHTPLFAYPSLMAVAAGTGVAGTVCALFDAKRGEVYAACYDVRPDGPYERLAPTAWRVEELLAELARQNLKPTFAGEGAIAYREAIAAAVAGATVLPEHLGIPRAASLLWLRRVAPGAGRVEEPAAWEPAYVRDWRLPREDG